MVKWETANTLDGRDVGNLGEQQWLEERFHKMQDILEESWAYQEMVQKGLAKGLEQGKQQGLEQGKRESLEQVIVQFVEIRFPDLVPLAKQQVAQATNAQHLHEMVGQLFAVHSEREARAVLLGEQE